MQQHLRDPVFLLPFEALCHSSEATTKAYLDKFEQTEIDNTFQHLL
jgi:hypothetical protein